MMLSAGEDAEKLEHAYIAVGCAEWSNHSKKSWVGSYQVKTALSIQSSNPTPKVFQRK